MQRLFDRLEGHPALRIPRPGPGVGHAAYKAYVHLRPERLAAGWTRERIITEVNALGVPCFSGSCSEIYREKAFTGAGLGPAERFPVARELGETSLMFLVHPTLTDAAMDRAAGALLEVLGRMESGNRLED